MSQQHQAEAAVLPVLLPQLADFRQQLDNVVAAL